MACVGIRRRIPLDGYGRWLDGLQGALEGREGCKICGVR